MGGLANVTVKVQCISFCGKRCRRLVYKLWRISFCGKRYRSAGIHRLAGMPAFVGARMPAFVGAGMPAFVGAGMPAFVGAGMPFQLGFKARKDIRQ